MWIPKGAELIRGRRLLEAQRFLRGNTVNISLKMKNKSWLSIQKLILKNE